MLGKKYRIVYLNNDKVSFGIICEVTGTMKTGGTYFDNGILKEEYQDIVTDLVTGKRIHPINIRSSSEVNRGLTYTRYLNVSSKIVYDKITELLNDKEKFDMYVKHIFSVEMTSIYKVDVIRRNINNNSTNEFDKRIVRIRTKGCDFK